MVDFEELFTTEDQRRLALLDKEFQVDSIKFSSLPVYSISQFLLASYFSSSQRSAIAISQTHATDLGQWRHKEKNGKKSQYQVVNIYPGYPFHKPLSYYTSCAIAFFIVSWRRPPGEKACLPTRAPHARTPLHHACLLFLLRNVQN
jgi:hypothetical protein